MRSTSCSGTGSITSTSPESSAATRVASLPIGVKTTSSTLPSALPHQLEFLTSTVRTDGWRSLQAERAGAVGVEAGGVLDPLAAVDRPLGLVLLAPLLAHHAERGERVGQDRVRRRGLDLDGEVVDLAHLLDRIGVALHVRAVAGGALEA